MPRGKSRIGGPVSDLPPKFEPPDDMIFVAQLDLSWIATHDKHGLLPNHGHLFFYFNYDGPRDVGLRHYFPGEAKNRRHRRAPPGTDNGPRLPDRRRRSPARPPCGSRPRRTRRGGTSRRRSRPAARQIARTLRPHRNNSRAPSRIPGARPRALPARVPATQAAPQLPPSRGVAFAGGHQHVAIAVRLHR